MRTTSRAKRTLSNLQSLSCVVPTRIYDPNSRQCSTVTVLCQQLYSNVPDNLSATNTRDVLPSLLDGVSIERLEHARPFDLSRISPNVGPPLPRFLPLVTSHERMHHRGTFPPTRRCPLESAIESYQYTIAFAAIRRSGAGAQSPSSI